MHSRLRVQGPSWRGGRVLRCVALLVFEQRRRNGAGTWPRVVIDWSLQEYGGNLKVVKIEADPNPNLIKSYEVYGEPRAQWQRWQCLLAVMQSLRGSSGPQPLARQWL